VYVLDLDATRATVITTDVEEIARIYALAAADEPELADLVDVALVAREDPHTTRVAAIRALADAPEDEPQLALARSAAFFADRLAERAAAPCARLPLPWPLDPPCTLDVVEDQLELHVGRIVELLGRGTLDDLIAVLRAPSIGDTLHALIVSGSA